MIVVMKPGSSQQQIDRVLQSIEQTGVRAQVIAGPSWTAIAVLGDKSIRNLDALADSVQAHLEELLAARD